jgi:hypothetical protein
MTMYLATLAGLLYVYMRMSIVIESGYPFTHAHTRTYTHVHTVLAGLLLRVPVTVSLRWRVCIEVRLRRRQE